MVVLYCFIGFSTDIEKEMYSIRNEATSWVKKCLGLPHCGAHRAAKVVTCARQAAESFKHVALLDSSQNTIRPMG